MEQQEATERANEILRSILDRRTADLAIVLKVSVDRLKLYLDCKRLTSAPIDRSMILAVVTELFPADVLNLTVIDSVIALLNQGKEVSNRKIHQGTAPRDGADGRIDFHVRKIVPPQPSPASEKRDTRYLRLLRNVESGMVLGRVVPPALGTNGRDVFGEPLKAKDGKPLKVACDATVLVTKSETGEEILIAQAAGYLTEERGRLKISRELTIQGDVDIDTGDIDFVGAVNIMGNVNKGYNVIARGDIFIAGGVLGGSLISHEGSIVVKDFVAGGTSYRIIAAKSFSAGMMQDMFVKAGDDITIAKECRDSILYAAKRVKLPTGHLFGGRINAGFGVEALLIGSSGESRTMITFADELVPDTEQQKLKRELKQVEEIIARLLAGLGTYAERREELDRLSPPERERYLPVLNKLCEVEDHKLSVSKALESIADTAADRKLMFRVNAHEQIYKGVEIKAFNKVFLVETDITGPRSIEYREAENEFAVGALSPLFETDTEREQKSKKGKATRSV